MKPADFQKLTNPGSVAVVGATDPQTSWFGGRAFRNLVQNSVGRRVYPINPRLAGTQLLDQPVYESIGGLPEAVDLAVVVVSASLVPGILDEVAQAGCRHVLLCAAYREPDPELSAAYADTLKRSAAKNNLCLVGGNSMGILNMNSDFRATFASASDFEIRPGSVAYLAQSGAALSYMLAEFQGRPLGYSHLISTGDENAVPLPELLEHVIEDEQTSAVLLFLEGVSDGLRLRQCFARAQSLGKPIAVLKVGRTAEGQQAATSHTGRMTGDDDVYRTVLAESGVYAARSYEELHDMGYRFGMGRRKSTAGRRAAVLTPSGGTGVLAADTLVEDGWTIPEPSQETAAKLIEAGANPPGNPMDVTGSFQIPDRLARMAEIMGSSGEYDEVFLLLGSGGDVAETIAENIAAAAPSVPVPLSASWIAPPGRTRDILEAAGLPVFPDPIRTIRASTAHAGASAEARANSTELSKLLAEQPSTRAIRHGDSVVTAAQLFEGLERAGMTTAPWTTVAPSLGDRELEAIGEKVGYPLVLKLDSPSMVHKTELDGVVVGIDGPGAFRSAAETMRSIEPARHPLACLLIQRMVSGVEVMLGAKWCDGYGHMLLVGLGGTRAELLADFNTVMLPSTRQQIADAVYHHDRLLKLLSGYRGDPRGDTESLVRLVWTFADWLGRDGARFDEVDLNPVIVTPDGAYIVDARAAAASPLKEVADV